MGRNVDARVAAAGVRVRGVPVANRASEASGGIVRVWCARSYCPMCAFSVSYVHGNVLARTACKKYNKEKEQVETERADEIPGDHREEPKM